MTKRFSVLTACLALTFGCGSDGAYEDEILSETTIPTLNQPQIPEDLPKVAINPHLLNLTIETTQPADQGAQKARLSPVLRNEEIIVPEIPLGTPRINPTEQAIQPIPNENEGIQGDDLCQALGFAGRTRGVIEDSAGLDLSIKKGTTIEGWIRLDNREGTILSKKGNSTDPFWTVSYEDGQLQFTVASDESHASIFSAEYPASEWFHFAIVRSVDLDDSVEIFIDGVASAERLQGGHEAKVISNHHPILIGLDNLKSEANFKGSLRNLHITASAQYLEDFEPQEELETTEDTFGAWEFSEARNGIILNGFQKSHYMILDGPIFHEPTQLCD